jgi:BirA family biotin operon repressor/biotin-[acetyl-CoA-carboxylase] ligase
MDPSDATSAARFLPLSAGVARELGPGPLDHVATTGSTNEDLASAARAGDGSGAVLVTDHQTAGKGRLGRRWEDVPGDSLLVSLRVPVPPDRAAAAVRALAAAARAAVDERCDPPVLAKWPNDLVVLDGAGAGKLAGVLAEFVDGPMPCVVIGIGINLRSADRGLGATSVVQCGGPDDRDGLLADILRGFARRLEDDAAVLEELRTHSATLGSPVRVELPDSTELRGTATELADDGSLVVTAADGSRHVVGVGDVIHLRRD